MLLQKKKWYSQYEVVYDTVVLYNTKHTAQPTNLFVVQIAKVFPEEQTAQFPDYSKLLCMRLPTVLA